MSLKIVLADDHKLMREGLKELINQKIGFEVVAEAETGHAAVMESIKSKADVVVMDISMPDLNGIEATREILRGRPETAVLALSMHTDRSFVTEMLRAGAKGYMIKDSAYDELIQAVTTVGRGQTYLSPTIAGLVVDSHVCHETPAEQNSAFSLLTVREREMLQLLAEGCTTKEIAEKVFRSVKTVETHRRNIMEKLDLHSIAELTKYAVRQGLTQLDD